MKYGDESVGTDVTTSEPHSVGIVVVNYNAGDLLSRSVTVALNSPQIAELVVVDNNSSDDSLAQLTAKVTDPRLNIVRQKENTGFGSAVNAGVARLSSTYVLLLNPDCFLRSGTITTLARVLEKRTDVAACGPVVLDVYGREQRGSRRHEPTPFRAIARTFGQSAGRGGGFDMHTAGLPQQPVAVDAVSGSCLLLRKQAFDALGGMDVNFFLHCEDLDLCRRFRDDNKAILFVPSTSVIHLQGGSGRNLKVEWYKHRSMIRYHAKHAGSESPRWLHGVLAAGVWARFAVIALPRSLAGRFRAEKLPAPERLVGLTGTPDRPVTVVTGYGRGASIALAELISRQGTRVIAAHRSPDLQFDFSALGDRSEIIVDAQYLEKVAPAELGDIDQLFSFDRLSDLAKSLPCYSRLGVSRIVAVVSDDGIEGKQSSVAQSVYEIADQYEIRLIVLNPTVTYGNQVGADLYRLQQFAEKYSRLPLLGAGRGIRQPLHIDDLLSACVAVQKNLSLRSTWYNIGGAQAMPHSTMLRQLLERCHPPVKLYRLPTAIAVIAEKVLRFVRLKHFDGLRQLIASNRDDICSNAAAAADFGFQPRPFDNPNS